MSQDMVTPFLDTLIPVSCIKKISLLNISPMNPSFNLLNIVMKSFQENLNNMPRSRIPGQMLMPILVHFFTVWVLENSIITQSSSQYQELLELWPIIFGLVPTDYPSKDQDPSMPNGLKKLSDLKLDSDLT